MIEENEPESLGAESNDARARPGKRGPRVHNPVAAFLGVERVRKCATRGLKPGRIQDCKLVLLAQRAKVRFCLCHYFKHPEGKVADAMEQKRMQIRYKLWMEQATRTLLSQVEGQEEKLAIEALAKPLPAELTSKFLTDFRTFKLVSAAEAAGFTNMLQTSASNALQGDLGLGFDDPE
eukprot:g20222.t1